MKCRPLRLLDPTPDGSRHTQDASTVAQKEVLDELVQAVGRAKSIDDQSTSGEDLGKVWPFDMR